MASLPSGTVIFLFTDIEGSTQLWERYPEAMRVALARHDALLRQAIESHRGCVFKTIGDAFCAAFWTVPEALAAAATAQHGLAVEPWGETGSLKVRMALHMGIAEERQGDYFGPPLNQVARLLSAAHGGQTLVSTATAELVRDQLPSGSALKSLGEHRLKDLPRPERIYQLVTSGLPAAFPPLRSLEVLRHNLHNVPTQLTSFVGREREMEELRGLLSTTRLLTLIGAGGCGKTRLSLQVAADLAEEYTDEVWFVDLAPLFDPELVPQSVASALGVREEPGKALLDTLVEYLSAKNLLLLLDNCEHLAAACAHLCDSLLRACPNLCILATSREALAIAGETVWPVTTLSLPDPKQPLTVETLRHSEAARLFLDRAVAAQPVFKVTEQNAGAVGEVCHRLDGIPLAIELAAARIKVLSLAQINERLEDRFRLLTRGSQMALPRQQTLRATMDWSYELLSEKERKLWQRLAVFAGGWSLEAAEAVCAGEEIEEVELLDLLSELVDKSVILVEAAAGEPARYRFLETIRQYGLERLGERGEEETVRRRHGEFFLAFVEKAEQQLTGPEQGPWLEKLEAEHDNVRGVLEWVLKSDARIGLKVAGAMWPFWQRRGYYQEGRKWLAAALAHPLSPGCTAERAKALGGTGVLAFVQGDYVIARSMLEEGLTLYRELENEPGIARCLNDLGGVAYEQADYGLARAHYEESLAIRRELGDKRGIAQSLSNLGDLARVQGDYGLARGRLEESLAIWRELGHKRGIAFCLNNLGSVANDQGDYGLAYALHEESRTIRRQLGDKYGIAECLHNLGNLARRQGEYGLVRTLYAESLQIGQELGSQNLIAHSLEALGELTQLEGKPGQAACLLGAAEALRETIGALLQPSERAEYDQTVAAVHTAMSEENFNAAWAQGRAMTLEQAITYALEETPQQRRMIPNGSSSLPAIEFSGQ